ncbi:plastocyanin/azurin family copper-binding protein [Colwelliaceae bacterium 6441]
MTDKTLTIKAKYLFTFILLILSVNAFAKDVVVEIYKKKFIPAHITIEKGDTVIWKNIEKRQYHNVWFKQFDKEEPDYFFPDESYQRTFSDSGEFPYECGPHPKMTGVVTVL